MIRFQCHHCGKKIAAPDESEARRVKCPGCSKVVVVPANSEVASAEESAIPLSQKAVNVGQSPPSNEEKDFHDRSRNSNTAQLSRPATEKGARPSQIVDVRPSINRNTTNGISKLEVARDQIYDWLTEAFKQRGVEPLVLKSYPFSPSVWVRCECWIPYETAQDLTHRTSAEITFHSKEFHEYEYELTVELRLKAKPNMFFSVIDFSFEDAKALVEVLLAKRTFKHLKFQFRTCRLFPLQFWLPRNKMLRLRLNYVPVILFVIGLLTLPAYGIGFLFLGISLFMFISSLLKKTYVISSGRPVQEPRNLIRMDSWQTLLNGLGTNIECVTSHLHQELTTAQPEALLVCDEKIWYLGVDGKEERCQKVVTFRRGIAFIHVYSYGDDLYVGWDSHVNCGSWAEKPSLISGIDQETGENCRLHTIEADWHVPNEYDITDTNCLAEWVHSSVSKVVKRMVDEHKVDQEFDFRILRGERNGVTGREQANDQDKTNTVTDKFRSFFSGSRFKREQ